MTESGVDRDRPVATAGAGIAGELIGIGQNDDRIREDRLAHDRHERRTADAGEQAARDDEQARPELRRDRLDERSAAGARDTAEDRDRPGAAGDVAVERGRDVGCGPRRESAAGARAHR